jgi:uncharacterized coiled-coil protein SlyX
MTAEERIQQVIGQQAFQIAILQNELEKAQGRIKELECQPALPASTRKK